MSFWLDSTSAFHMFVNQVTGFYAFFCGISNKIILIVFVTWFPKCKPADKMEQHFPSVSS
jgi:hypothetical protein